MRSQGVAEMEEMGAVFSESPETIPNGCEALPREGICPGLT